MPRAAVGDVSGTEAEYAIQAELPGVKKADVRVTLDWRAHDSRRVTAGGDGVWAKASPG